MLSENTPWLSSETRELEGYLTSPFFNSKGEKKAGGMLFVFLTHNNSKAEIIKRTYGELKKVAKLGCSDSMNYPNPERSAQRGNCTKAV